METNKSPKIDLVCGMNLEGFERLSNFEHQGKRFDFCGEVCSSRFQNNPEKFLGEPLVKLKNIWKVFKPGDVEIKVLQGVDIHIWEGDFVSMIGASGSGKSTVLNMMGLLDTPTSGEVFIRGKDVSKFSDDERARMRSEIFGFVFQQYNLIPWLNARENTVIPLIFAGEDEGKAVKLESYFKELGLAERATHRPFELSGGEQQRVALIRALANDPEIILGDEPTGNLDSATGNKILETLITLNKTHKKTLIIVTHDADIAEKADQVITIKDGRVVRNHQMHKKIYTE